MPANDEPLRVKLAAVEKSTAQALQFAPVHVRATAEFLAKPLHELLRELVNRVETLERKAGNE